MTAHITSSFENRDMADLAVMRLRRAGVAFSVSRVAPTNRTPGSSADFPLMPSAVNRFDVFGAADPYTYGSMRHGRSDGTVLSLRVRSDQLERVREILRSASATNIRTEI